MSPRCVFEEAGIKVSVYQNEEGVAVVVEGARGVLETEGSTTTVALKPHIAEGSGSASSPTCSFCGKSRETVGKLISGSQDKVRVCEECVSLFNDIIFFEDHQAGRDPKWIRNRTEPHE